MKKVVIVLIVVAVLAVTALLSGVFVTKEKNAAPTPAPVTPTTTPAPLPLGKVLTAEELLGLAKAGKLNRGDTVTVSGVVEDIPGVNVYLRGKVIIENTNWFLSVKIGDRVVVRGKISSPSPPPVVEKSELISKERDP